MLFRLFIDLAVLRENFCLNTDVLTWHYFNVVAIEDDKGCMRTFLEYCVATFEEVGGGIGFEFLVLN